jgi:hypothetical protein
MVQKNSYKKYIPYLANWVGAKIYVLRHNNL